MTDNVQITMPPDSNSNPEQTPVEATFSPQDENVVIEITPQDTSSRKIDLYSYALRDRWPEAKVIYDKFRDMVRIPLTTNGDTALHVAVSANSAKFVKGFVELEFVTPDDLKIPNADGNTPFCLAAVSGNDGFFEIMIRKNADLPLIPGQDKMLPVHLAALTGQRKIVQDLSISSAQNLLHRMVTEDIERLFFMTISSGMYGVATKLFEIYQDLAIARDDNQQTALHKLARKPSEEFYVATNFFEIYQDLAIVRDDNQQTALHKLARKPSEEFFSNTLRDMEKYWDEERSSKGLLKKLWSHIRQLEHQKTLDLISRPSAVLFDAVKYGNVNFVKCLLSENRGLLTQKESGTGRNLLHFAILYRQRKIFEFICEMETVDLIQRAVDKEYNNALHFAASLPEASSNLRPIIQMQMDLLWFQEVTKWVPFDLEACENNKGKIPIDAFYDNRQKLSDRVRDEAKETANHSMLLATLIAALVFAAALTVPGDKASAWFIVFILTNAVALFTSSASIISFLSIFTSSKYSTDREFISSLHPTLNLGLALLFISIAAMVIAFAAASFLIFEHRSMWVAYVVASMGILPILAFLVLHFSLFDGLLEYGFTIIISFISLIMFQIYRIKYWIYYTAYH